MEDIRLSKNFLLSELIKSDIAIRKGIDNYPKDKAVINNLAKLCQKILQPCRDKFGKIHPTSGFRCLELNRLIGSKDSSQHILGQAVDFEIPSVPNYKLAYWIRDNIPVFDQIILEHYIKGQPGSGWVHVSLKEKGNRKECLTWDGNKFMEGLTE
jgi:zinc D-Ala-D-Ala carboxypeptidase